MQSAPTATLAPRTSHLVKLAIKGLDSMYVPEKGLFCHRLQKTVEGMTREGISHRYTMMTLLGLLRADSAGLRPPVDIEATVDRLLDDTTWLDKLGDLGLLLWLCAATSRKHVRRFYTVFDLVGALERFPDARHRLTMELSWFLTGLAHASKTEHAAALEPLATETYRLVSANQGEHGLFGHMAKGRSLAGLVRGTVGSFADQVYPIFAMACFSRVFGNKEACDSAVRCARAICRLQGSLGQWWWRYDSVAGLVIGHYPVYSVHQHAMAPMALLALQETCGVDFRVPIDNGLKWITGSNELHQDLQDANAGVVWRCIQTKKSSYVAGIQALMGKEPILGPLQTLYECRPYELGWLLYALAQPGLGLSSPA
jgi:hypothetical protein